MSDLVCEHGSFRRKCEICERDERIKELETVVVRVINDVKNGYFGFDPYYRKIQEETMKALKESLHGVDGGGDE